MSLGPGQHLHALGSIGRFVHELVHFFHGEAQHRHQHDDQFPQDLGHGRLGRAAGLAVLLAGV